MAWASGVLLSLCRPCPFLRRKKRRMEKTQEMIRQLARELSLREEQVAAAVKLIDEGNTIPFIAR